VYVCVGVCVRACVRVCGRVCVCACVCMCVCVYFITPFSRCFVPLSLLSGTGLVRLRRRRVGRAGRAVVMFMLMDQAITSDLWKLVSNN